MESIQLEAWVVALLAGTIIPIVTGLVTKFEASTGLKAGVAFVLSAALAAINAIVVADGVYLTRDIVVLFVTTFAWNVATYHGVWKPMGGGAPPLAKATAGTGLS